MLDLIRRLFRRILKSLLGLLGTESESEPPNKTDTKTITEPEAKTPLTLPPKVSALELGLSSSESPHYRKNKSLFTNQELVFYKVLCEAANTGYQIFAKVRMADFVWLVNEPANRKFHNSQILCKHVDFLLCEKEALKPLLVIELDDGSHRKYDSRERDEFKDKTFAAIGLPILRITVQAYYSASELSEQIRSAIREGIGK